MCKALGNPFETRGGWEIHEHTEGISKESFMYLMWKYTEAYDWRKLLHTSISIKALDRKYQTHKQVVKHAGKEGREATEAELKMLEDLRRETLMELFAKVFMLLDTDGDNCLEWDEFREVLALGLLP